MRTAQTGGRLAPTHPCLEARIRYHATAAFATVGGQNNGRSARTRRASGLRYATAGRVASRASRPGGCGPRPGGVPWGDGRGCPRRSHDAPPGARRGRTNCHASRRMPADRATSVMRGATPGATDDDGGKRIGRVGGATVEVARRAVEHPPRSHEVPRRPPRAGRSCDLGGTGAGGQLCRTATGGPTGQSARPRSQDPPSDECRGRTNCRADACEAADRATSAPGRGPAKPTDPPAEATRPPPDRRRQAPAAPRATRRRRAAARAPARSAPRAPAAPSASASARRGARRSRAPRSRRAPRPTPGGRRPSRRVRPARSRR